MYMMTMHPRHEIRITFAFIQTAFIKSLKNRQGKWMPNDVSVNWAIITGLDQGLLSFQCKAIIGNNAG